MSGIHKILVPVDFSTCSRRALEHACELSERYYGASIDVLHVWELPSYLGPGATLVTPNGIKQPVEHVARVEAMKEMEAFLAQVESREVVRVKRLHEAGDTVRTILETAQKGHHDLIVMGTHGRTGIAHDYLGSVAEKVVRRAPCPVLTFREVHATAKKAEASATAEPAKVSS